MTSEAEVRAFRQAPVGAWPTDDTEESVVGTNLHQVAIINLHLGITEAAELHRQVGDPVPWEALTQTILLGCQRPDGSEYRTLPDIFVYPHAIDPQRPSVAIAVDGPPLLIVEVLSPSTYDVDLNVEKGKDYSCARAGVREYLALDPVRHFVPRRGGAKRLAEGI
jgi:Putative restriction endonuclease